MKQEITITITETPESPNLAQHSPLFIQQNGPDSPLNSSKQTKFGFDVGDRYQVLKTVGSGAYGTVCCALDLHTGNLVAIKKLPCIFADSKEAKRAVREVRLLSHFRGEENILQILDLFHGHNEEDNSFRDLYIVTEFLAEGDALSLCSDKEKKDSLKEDRRLATLIYSLVQGLVSIHAAGVLHRDLRLKNLLINENKLKICDFGAGRAQQAVKRQPSIKLSLLSYVSSQYFTAPEALLPNTGYSAAVDMWASGCIMAELVLGRTLFKGEKSCLSSLDQFKLITDIIGFDLDEEAICRFNPQERFRKFLRESSLKPSRLSEVFESSSLSVEGLSFLQSLLCLDPEKRITAAEALNHPWFEGIREEKGKEKVEKLPFNGDDIEEAETREEIRGLLLQEIQVFRGQLTSES